MKWLNRDASVVVDLNLVFRIVLHETFRIFILTQCPRLVPAVGACCECTCPRVNVIR